ncbi:hypothetical protein O3G_MSEX013523 [Manduca sexta]|uniref:Uncharacterized protein n=1 Tax=Manduca sexta TaxID=7130 RepID=A0A921ZRG4_MANSE|nr:hypothetical protein O3G_MSEX013523 [Manduca sexta]
MAKIQEFCRLQDYWVSTRYLIQKYYQRLMVVCNQEKCSYLDWSCWIAVSPNYDCEGTEYRGVLRTHLCTKIFAAYLAYLH